jgi:hypothetical protein
VQIHMLHVCVATHIRKASRNSSGTIHAWSTQGAWVSCLQAKGPICIRVPKPPVIYSVPDEDAAAWSGFHLTKRKHPVYVAMSSC